MADLGYQVYEDDEQTSARVLKVGKRRYVANMAWRSIENPSQAFKEARELAKREQMNLVMVYEGFTKQAGLVDAPNNKFRLYEGAYSLAAVLANFLGESWLGVFSLDDGNYLLVAVKDGAIIPGFDLVGNPQQIREKALSIRRAHKWADIYVPEDDDILKQEFSELSAQGDDLAAMLEQAKHQRSHRLAHANARFGGALKPSTIFLVCLVLALGAGGVYYLQVLKPADDKFAQLRLAQNALELNAQKANALKEVGEAAIRPDWIDKPETIALLDNCLNELVRLPAHVIDWMLKSVDCRATAIVGNYERKTGGATMEQVASVIKAYSINNVQSHKAVVGFKLQAPPARQDGESVQDDIRWMRRWVSYFQAFEISKSAQLDITPRPHPKPPPPKASWVRLLGQEKAQVTPPWWLTYEWEIKLVGLDPKQVLEALPQKGVVLHSAVATYEPKESQFKWVLKGQANTRP